MGNSTTESKTSIEEMLQEFNEVRRDSNGIVLEDEQAQSSYFLKELTFADAKEFEREKQRLQQQQQNENILKLIKVSCQQFNSFCSNSYKIYAIYEYPAITLLDEINARNAQSKYFEESQLWSILQSCVNAFHQLIPALSLHPKFVFVMPDGILKVICNDLIEQDHRCILKQSTYYAPEKICDFHQNQSETNLQKEGIFSLGMTLLHAALLKQVKQCYDYNKYQFLNNQLENYIEQLQKLEYSSQFIEIMAIILQPNPIRRSSLIQLQQMLKKYYETKTYSQQSNNFSENQSDQISEANQEQRYQRDNKNINLLNQQKQMNFLNSKHQQNLQKPSNYISEPSQSSKDKQNLFTDPKLLEMIRKDLYEIQELKKNSYCPFNNYDVIGSSHSRSFTSTYNTPFIHHSNQPTIYNTFQPDRRDSHRSSVGNLSHDIKQSKSVAQNIQNVFQKHNNSKRKVLKEVSSNEAEKKAFTKPKNQEQPVYITEEFEDGRKFQGNIINGVKEGYGKLTYSDGAYYEGDFHQNKMEGKGVLYYQADHPAYDGQWANDQFHGFGILFNENPIALNDQFNYNDFNMIDDYWMRYEGFFDRDNKCGQGKLFLSNGQRFEGLFQNDTITGRGKFVSKNEDGSFEQIHGVWEDNALVQLIQNA